MTRVVRVVRVRTVPGFGISTVVVVMRGVLLFKTPLLFQNVVRVRRIILMLMFVSCRVDFRLHMNPSFVSHQHLLADHYCLSL